MHSSVICFLTWTVIIKKVFGTTCFKITLCPMCLGVFFPQGILDVPAALQVFLCSVAGDAVRGGERSGRLHVLERRRRGREVREMSSVLQQTWAVFGILSFTAVGDILFIRSSATAGDLSFPPNDRFRDLTVLQWMGQYEFWVQSDLERKATDPLCVCCEGQCQAGWVSLPDCC